MKSIEAVYQVVGSSSDLGPPDPSVASPKRPVHGYATLTHRNQPLERRAAAAASRRPLSDIVTGTPLQQATFHRRAAGQMPSLTQAVEVKKLGAAERGRPRQDHPAPPTTRRAFSDDGPRSSGATDLSLVSDRPIAMPKSRLSKLMPAHRQMPSSKEVTTKRSGGLAGWRPEVMTAFIDTVADEPDPSVSESYYADPGYDMVQSNIGSSLCRSFDIDELPEGPKRSLSAYRRNSRESLARSPSPESSQVMGNGDILSSATTVPIARSHTS
ncbi:hypothetical protein H4R19_001846 [Coemansia spiralis]|nr:hypothetical protein H4R19_001846 [Coemansia spiralis]